jgi:hypothetical protein
MPATAARPAESRQHLGETLLTGFMDLLALPPGTPSREGTPAHQALRAMQRFGVDRALRLLMPRLGQHARAMMAVSAWPLRGYR